MIKEIDIENYLNFDKLTKDQVNAIKRDTPILVFASAGSGKTTVLATRVVYNLLSPNRNYNKNKILVVTFTKAAAQEMKVRINNLYNKVVSNIYDNQKINNENLELMKIMTIDSFCASFLRENFEKANLSPDFYISDENMSAKLKEDVIEEIFENEYKENSDEFQLLVDHFSLKGDYKLKEIILLLYKTIKKQPFKEEWEENLLKDYLNPPKIYKSKWANDVKNYIENEIEYIKEKFNENLYILDEDKVLKESYINVALEYISSLSQLKQNISTSDYITTIQLIKNFNILTFPRYHKDKNPFNRELAETFKKNTVTLLKNLIKNLQNNYFIDEKSYKDDMKTQLKIIKELLELNDKFTNLYEEKKREQNTLDFDDLIEKTINLLVKNSKLEKTQLGKLIEEEYDEILIDEYQDVNESQDCLFNILSKSQQNLFMVGDIKQSIYRFRGADADVFMKRAEKLKKDTPNQIINLTSNFRSRNEVTKSVNYIFKNLMSDKFGGVNYDKTQSLKSAGEFIEKGDNYKTEIHFLNQTTKQKEALIEEADHIGYIIKSMIDKGFKVQDKNGVRNCKLSDFAILLRSSQNNSQIIEERLNKIGIYVKQEGITSYFKSREVSIIISLLKVINNPLNDLPLFSVITSPLFNFDEDEIAKIRLIDKDASLYKCILNSKTKKCRNFIKYIYKLRKDAINLQPSELIQEIYDTTYYYSICGALTSGEQKIANLRLLINYAKKYQQTSQDGLGGFLKMIDKMKSINKDFESANVTLGADNAVKIMTIHKSKGLEFPIVILARTNTKFNEKDLKNPILFTKKFKLAMKNSKPQEQSRYTTLPYLASLEYERKKQKEEELRILYVALTRAKEKLIITTAKKAPKPNDVKRNVLREKSNSINDFITSVIDKDSEDLFIYKEGLKSVKEKEESKKEAVISKEKLKILENNFNYKYKNEDYTKIPLKLSVSELAKDNNNFKLELKNPNFDEGMTPAEKGTAMHEFLQYANYENAQKDIESEIDRLVKDEFISIKQAKSLNIKNLNDFFRSSFYKRIENSDKIEREKSFLYELPIEVIDKNLKDEKILIQGIADCIIEENNELVIIDYKTDRINEAKLIKNYKQQLKIYKHAIEKITQKKVKECYLYSLYLNKEIKVL